MTNQDLSKKHIYYYQEKTNDIIDLQDDYSIEEVGLFTILKATYFKHKGVVPIEKLSRLSRFYGSQKKIKDFAEKIFLQKEGFYKNLEWDLEIDKINKTSASRRKAVLDRWNKEKNQNESQVESDEKPITPKTPKEDKPPKEGFIKPILQEVEEYNSSRGGIVDAKKFFDYYEAGNWKDQKGNKIKNWRQKLITWENKTNTTKTTGIDFNKLNLN
jgi:uncharacterized protein YdaU (DUF1376 family)